MPVHNSPPTPLLIGTTDTRGGAALATYRLHQSLLAQGIDSRMLVHYKHSHDREVLSTLPEMNKLRRQSAKYAVRLDKKPLRFYQGDQRKAYWSLNWTPSGAVAGLVNRLNPNIAHLHWIGDGFIPISAIPNIKAPIVWTLHDMWGFTGGCHITFGCEQYQTGCGHCPQLASDKAFDLSKWIFNRKQKHWANIPMTIVTPSHWLADLARHSPLFENKRIEVIPHGIDATLFKPVDQQLARASLNLPADKRLILFGATGGTRDPNKGFPQLQMALQSLTANGWGSEVELVIFGENQPKNPPNIALPTHYLGELHDPYSLVLAYSSADVFVFPSLQESFGMTVMEALACGTPVVASGIGGIPDMITHCENGYITIEKDANDLAKGIQWVLEEEEQGRILSAHARKTIEDNFQQVDIARRYIDLYQQVLASG